MNGVGAETTININLNNLIVREDADIERLTTAISKELQRQADRQRRGRGQMLGLYRIPL